jgi:hypothetical protein
MRVFHKKSDLLTIIYYFGSHKVNYLLFKDYKTIKIKSKMSDKLGFW